MSSQKKDLTLQSKVASYQLETFFEKYTTMVQQMALNPDMQEILTETRAGDSILEADNYPDVYKQLQGKSIRTVRIYLQHGWGILMQMC